METLINIRKVDKGNNLNVILKSIFKKLNHLLIYINKIILQTQSLPNLRNINAIKKEIRIKDNKFQIRTYGNINLKRKHLSMKKVTKVKVTLIRKMMIKIQKKIYFI